MLPSFLDSGSRHEEGDPQPPVEPPGWYSPARPGSRSAQLTGSRPHARRRRPFLTARLPTGRNGPTQRGGNFPVSRTAGFQPSTEAADDSTLGGTGAGVPDEHVRVSSASEGYQTLARCVDGRARVPKVSLKTGCQGPTSRSDSRFRRSADTFQQRDAFHVAGHREDADGIERERDPLPMTAGSQFELIHDESLVHLELELTVRRRGSGIAGASLDFKFVGADPSSLADTRPPPTVDVELPAHGR